MTQKIKKRWGLLILALLLAFLIYPPAVFVKVQINFGEADYTAGNHWKVLTSYRENVGVDSVERTYENPGTAWVSFLDFSFRKGDYVKRMDPSDYFYEKEILLRDLTLFVNGFYAGRLEGEELLRAFSPNEQVRIYEAKEGLLGISVAGEDSQLLTTESFHEFYAAAAGRYARTGVLYLLLTLAALAFVLAFYRRRVRKQGETRLIRFTDALLYGIAVAVLALILKGALFGSPAINPDESESFYSVNYYIHHWKIPDIRELEPEAFSKFGTARLSELSLYYIISAQIARFFTLENAVRFFSVLMAAGLFYLLFSNLRKNRYLLCVLFLTPQIWYLYTYCTSDALDFTVAVLVLYQLANPQSMLQKLLRTGIGKRDVWRVLLLGFLFSNIFMSKQNYYVIAIYAFSILLTELMMAKGEERKKKFRSCLLLAGASLLFLGIRYIPEFLHYGIYKQKVIVELQNEIAIPELRPASLPEVQSPAFNIHGKGVPLRELLFGMGLHTMLFRSFTGTYGCLEFPSPKWYFSLMGILYLIFYVLVSVSVLKGRGEKERKIKWGLLHFCSLVFYGLVIFNAYYIDFQAQGRYLLPVLVFFAHGAALNPETVKTKWFQILLCITALLSLYSFAVFGIPNIQPA